MVRCVGIVDLLRIGCCAHFSNFAYLIYFEIKWSLENDKKISRLTLFCFTWSYVWWNCWLVIYLGIPKSSGGCILFSYKRLKEIFLFYGVIEKPKLYFSILFHPYPTSTIIIKFRQELIFCVKFHYNIGSYFHPCALFFWLLLCSSLLIADRS